MHKKINSELEPLNDTDKMPFGTYRDVLMQDVPCDYLNWFYNTCRIVPKTPGERVLGYIVENLNALKQEDDNLIWKRTI